MLPLQAALFAAGARQVIGALWPVNEDVAPNLMRSLQGELLANMPADVALQRAVVAFLQAASGRVQLPYYWAPLFLSAMGRTRRPF